MNKEYDERHGGAYDRGTADSYYRRSRAPHYYLGATGTSKRIELTPEDAEWEAYMAGYDHNEQEGFFKSYL